MNNLKRVFSLVLALVMVIGLVMVGASAASADFDDSDEITKTEAVNTLVALGVIKGKDDGSFHPTDDVTRGEMAKMIYVVMNNGKDNPNLTTKATPSFTDIKGHWAEGYIEYCYSTGIISGRGDGTFDPNANVTAQEAAKMVLIALGYSEKEEELTGKDWALHTNILALQNDLYDNVDPLPSADVDRDNAAQIIFNAGNAYVIEKYEGSLTTDVNGNLKTEGTAVQSTTTTLFAKKFGLDYGTSFLAGIKLEDGTYEYTLTAASSSNFGGTDGNYTKTFKTTDDYTNLFGQKVQVIYKKSSNSPTNDTVYGLKGLGKVVAEGVYSGASNDTKNTSLKKNFNTTDTATPKDIDTYVAIDNGSSDGKATVVIVTPVVASKVSAKSSSAITLNPAVETSGAALELKNVTGADDLVKGDYVLATPAANTVDGKTALVKAEIVEGTVAASRASNTEVQIDGTWYKPASALLPGSGAMTLNNDVTLVVANGLYVYAEQAAAAVSKDLVVLTKVATDDNFDGTYDAKISDLDGTVTTVKINDNAGSGWTDADAGKLYTYSVKDSVYTLTAATTANTGYGAAVSTGLFNGTTDKVGDAYIADDAKVIVLHNLASGNSTVTGTITDANVQTLKNADAIDGAALKKWTAANYGDSARAVGFTEKVNGIDYVKVLVLAFEGTNLPGATLSDSYGYIVSDPYAEKDGSTTYTVFDLWNGTETVTVKQAENSIDTTSIVKGKAVSYKDEGDGVVSSVTKIDTLGAITGYSATEKVISILGDDGTAISTATKVSDDTVYVYIDSKNVAGADKVDVELATVTNGVYDMNVYVKDDGSDTVLVLFVDVNNKIGSTVVAEPAGEIETSGKTITLADIKEEGTGVHSFNSTEPSAVTAGGVAGVTKENLKYVVAFVFDASNASATQAYTLTVKNADGDTVYTETTASLTAAKHTFFVNASNTSGTETADKSGKWSGNMNATGTYTYTIVGADNVTYAQGAYYWTQVA